PSHSLLIILIFFYNAPPTTKIYTLSLHDALPIYELVYFHKNYEAMQFLIDRGIDMTIVDYRWRSTAQGWASYAVKDEKMAQWLRSEEHTSELQSRFDLVCRLLLEKKK